MENDKSFKTKTGYCQVLPDKIVLARAGTTSGATQALAGNRLVRLLLSYSLLAAFLLYNAYTSLAAQQYGLALLLAVPGLWLLYGIVRSRNNSATSVIPRASIQTVRFKPARPGLTRAYFEVFFIEDNSVKKRLIMLPGSLSGGPGETAKAVAILASEKLLTSL